MNKNSIILLVAIAIIALSFILGNSAGQGKLGFSINTQPTAWYSTSSHFTATTVWSYATTAAPLALAKNLNRVWARCCNNSAIVGGTTTYVWLHEVDGTTSVAINKGIRLDSATSSPWNCFEWDDLHPYQGAVYAIATPTGTVACSEK